jgi:ketosteroid isomerase-like protein
MASANVEVVRRGHAAFNRGDFSALADETTQDVEWGTANWPGMAAVYYGQDGVAEWGTMIRSAWEDFEVSLVEVLDEAGEHVVVAEHLRARGLGSGVELEAQLFSAYFFRDGQVARRQIFTEKAEALGRVEMRE